MKYLYLLILLLLLAVETSSQTLSNSSGLSVIHKKWRMTSINPHNSIDNEDPFRVNDEANQSIRDQKNTLRQNVIRQQAGLPVIPPPVRQKAIEAEKRSELSTSYIYQIKVKNNGTKTIKKVVWEYVFFDSNTKQVLGRHRFISNTNLKPRETDTLIMKQFSAPTGSIDAKDAGKKLSNLYVEQVNIKSIQYTDDSVWQSDSK
jgi:hypothetical protein